jgi:hypothetical protein
LPAATLVDLERVRAREDVLLLVRERGEQRAEAALIDALGVYACDRVDLLLRDERLASVSYREIPARRVHSRDLCNFSFFQLCTADFPAPGESLTVSDSVSGVVRRFRRY